jgi:tetratricopeptide (TPR) repeat protein
MGTAVAALGALSILTIRQIPVWTDGASLWTHALEVEGESYVPLRNLSELSYDNDEYEAAASYAARAVAADDKAYFGRVAQAQALVELGRYDEALAALRVLESKRSEDVWMHRLSAEAYERSGRFQEAAPHRRRVIEIMPTGAVPWSDHVALAGTLSELADVTGAAEQLAKADALKPDWRQELFTTTWTTVNDPVHGPRRARRMLASAQLLARIERDNAQVLDLLAAAQANAGNFDLAVEAAHRALTALDADPEMAALRPTLSDHLSAFEAHRPLRTPTQAR